jgi:hypothetical protein
MIQRSRRLTPRGRPRGRSGRSTGAHHE